MKIILFTINSMIMMMPILMSVAYLTLLESKILGYSQLSKGPNVVGLYGILQPLADGVKLFTKEMVLPSHINLMIYMMSPMLTLMMGLMPWFMFPWGGLKEGVLMEHPYSLLLMLAMLSMGMFGVLLSGWSSNSKYAFLGSMSAVAQMMSYEVSLSLILMSVIMVTGSLNLSYMYQIQSLTNFLLVSLWPMSFMYLMSMLAETNSAPFDLSEGESELVSGYNVEYSSMAFALFFLAEYSHMMFSSFIFVMLFMGELNLNLMNIKSGLNWIYTPLIMSLKGAMMSFMFLWVSTSFPSMSYDQLMSLLWKNYLPLSMSLLWIMNTVIMGFNIGISSSMT